MARSNVAVVESRMPGARVVAGESGWVRRVRDRLPFPANAAAIGAIVGAVIGGIVAVACPGSVDISTGTSVGGVGGSGLAAVVAWLVDRPVSSLSAWDHHLRERMRQLWVSGPRAPLAATRSTGGVLERLPTRGGKVLQSSDLAAVVGRVRRWLPVPGHVAPGELFDRFDGSMLLVGAPGAGKSVLLWEMLAALLDRDRAASSCTPVLIELHRWQSYDSPAVGPQPSFTGFVQRELAASPVNVPVDVVRLLLDDMVFLLDGLDELSDDLAVRCLEALRDFALGGPAERRRRRIVMTCRADDYERIAARWDTPNTVVTHAVRILPLSGHDVRRVLERSNPSGRRLMAAGARVPALDGMLRTPLWLSIAAHVYRYTPRSDPLSALDPAADQPTVEQALYERWIDLQLRGRSRRLRGQLGFLAERMRVNGQQTIYLEDVQPRWLPDGAPVRFMRALVYAASTLVGIWLMLGLLALFSAVTGADLGPFNSGGLVQNGLTIAVPGALSAAVVHWAPDTVRVTRRRMAMSVAWQLPAVLLGLGALLVALNTVVNPYWFMFYGVFVWVVFRATTTGSESSRPLVAAARRLVRRRLLVRHNVMTGMVLGVIAGTYVAAVLTRDAPLVLRSIAAVMVALVATSAFMMHAAMVAIPADRVHALRPSSALLRSGRTGIVTGLIVLPAVVATAVLVAVVFVIIVLAVRGVGDTSLTWLAASVAGTAQSTVLLASSVWAPIAVVTALEGGGGAVAEHFAARVILAGRRWLPLALVTLLDEAARDGILYPVGPGWRFRHRTLARQFAVHAATQSVGSRASGHSDRGN